MMPFQSVILTGRCPVLGLSPFQGFFFNPPPSPQYHHVPLLRKSLPVVAICCEVDAEHIGCQALAFVGAVPADGLVVGAEDEFAPSVVDGQFHAGDDVAADEQQVVVAIAVRGEGIGEENVRLVAIGVQNHDGVGSGR